MIDATPKYQRIRFAGGRHKNFGYDAVNADQNKRRMAPAILRSEDWELLPSSRKQLVASQRDIGRNFAVARWIMERHLDYVTTFAFKFRSKNEGLNQMVQKKMAAWQRRQNSDQARRHSFGTCIRFAEASALTANDCLAIKLANGKVQWIEGDRVNNPGIGLPPTIDPRQLVHGVLVDDSTATQRYIVCRRGPKGSAWQAPSVLTFDQIVEADDAVLHGFFDRFDQVRGVSPLASALNSLQDVYEAKTYALGRMKVDQLWALAVYRGDVDNLVEGRVDANGNRVGKDYTKLPIGNGPVIADMDVGDRMEAIQSSQPSNQFQDFMVKALSFSMKALAIPYSFSDDFHKNKLSCHTTHRCYGNFADFMRTANRGTEPRSTTKARCSRGSVVQRLFEGQTNQTTVVIDGDDPQSARIVIATARAFCIWRRARTHVEIGRMAA